MSLIIPKPTLFPPMGELHGLVEFVMVKDIGMLHKKSFQDYIFFL